MQKRRESGLELYPPGALKKSKSWYIRGTHNGVTVFESARTSQKAVARRRLTEIEDEIGQESYRPHPSAREAEEPIFADAVAEYLKQCSSKSEARYLLRILAKIEMVPLSEINQAIIDKVVSELYPSAAPSTINRNVITPISSVMHLAAEHELCPYLRVRRRKEPPAKNRDIEKHDATRFFAALPETITNRNGRIRYPHALAKFLFWTGARVGEGVKLDWDSVYLNRQPPEVRFIDTKNGETYDVYLPRDLLLEFANLPHRTGKVFGYRDRQEVAADWQPITAGLGIKLTPHGARHSFATWLRQDGADLRLIMALGRWKSVKNVMRYANAPTTEQRAAIDRLSESVNLSVKNTQKISTN